MNFLAFKRLSIEFCFFEVFYSLKLVLAYNLNLECDLLQHLIKATSFFWLLGELDSVQHGGSFS